MNSLIFQERELGVNNLLQVTSLRHIQNMNPSLSYAKDSILQERSKFHCETKFRKFRKAYRYLPIPLGPILETCYQPFPFPPQNTTALS